MKELAEAILPLILLRQQYGRNVSVAVYAVLYDVFFCNI